MAGQITPLEPERLGVLFGDSSPVNKLPLIGRLVPMNRFLFLWVSLALAVLLLANADDALVSTPGKSSAISVLVKAPDRTGQFDLPLLLDPVGLIVLLVCLGTPYFCARQISAIGVFVSMNENNLSEKAAGRVRVGEVNDLVAVANRRFGLVGSRSISGVILVLTAAATLGLWTLLRDHGVMQSWNNTGVTDEAWRESVYAGWWANPDHHLPLTIVLCLLGWFMFYFLTKQLLMGLIFALFAKSAAEVGFGVTPNLEYNSDGYAGLLELRRFMQWTYGSSLAHFLLTLGVFVIWLPVTTQTLFLCLAIAITNAVVVVYPSNIAKNSAQFAKSEYAKDVSARTDIDEQTKRERIEQVWTSPGLPFRTRSSLTAVTVYLLAPLFLAVVSAIISD